MSDHVEFTSNWKDAFPLDNSAQQIISFLYPDRKCLARLKPANLPQERSVTLWSDAKACFLVYLSDQVMKEDALLHIVSSVERVMRQEAFASERWLASLSVNLFAQKFEANLISKFRFLTLNISAYEWSVSSKDGKETILVREVKQHKTEMGIQTDFVAPKSQRQLFPNELTSEELSAFVQLGMDLRKIR